jgi:hypothetical protein
MLGFRLSDAFPLSHTRCKRQEQANLLSPANLHFARGDAARGDAPQGAQITNASTHTDHNAVTHNQHLKLYSTHNGLRCSLYTM